MISYILMSAGAARAFLHHLPFLFVVCNYVIHFLFLQVYMMGVMEFLHVVPPLSTEHSGECGAVFHISRLSSYYHHILILELAKSPAYKSL